ncbi:MAG: outer membrane protein assembly factor BamA, partial [Gammaproteobacteria bacterium]
SEQGVRLKVRVEEYPLIAKVNLIGNEEVKSKDLKLRLKLKPGYVLSPTLMNADRNTIRKGYLKKGYYQVQVDFIPHALKDGRVNLDIVIDEGDITRIQRIKFIGNKAFTDAELADVIASRTSSLVTWFTDRDVFDRKRFAADGQLLLQHYQNNGYLDVKIESTRLSMSEDKRHFDLTFAIDEGTQYRVSSLNLKGDIVPDEKTLLGLVSLEKGDIYSLQKLRESINAISERVGDEGYAFATVTPLFRRNMEKHVVDISFDIEKGHEVYVERIEISGNEKTDDSVVRRELKQSEAARYSASQINRSRKALNKSRLYKDVRFSFPRGSDPNKVKMKVDLEENKSGSFTFGMGYSQVEKVFFNAKISDNNILGHGYEGSLNGTFGAQTKNYTARITDPYFLGKNLRASLN